MREFRLLIESILYWSLWVLAIFLIYRGCTYTAKAEEQKYTKIQVFSPYSIGMRLETKCDWIPEKKKYKYFKRFSVPGKSQMTIEVPQGLKSCEIWPLDIIF